MRHRNRLNKLGISASHRKSMVRNMATSLFKSEAITTTRAKAKVVQRAAEKMITRAKVDSVHNRREINKDIKNDGVLNKLFTAIAPMFANRNGGYTRILKLGPRLGDGAEMVLLELVEKTAADAKPAKSENKTSEVKAKAQPKAEKATVAEAEVAEAEVVSEPAKAAASEEPKVEEAVSEASEATETEAE